MNCPKCNANLLFKVNKCEQCGQDLKTYKKIIGASNIFYNDGLSRAKIRDLSGAAASLKKSLQIYKRNTNARNLLGLVYFEMGETVSALSEWVISKHFQPENNDADRYMESLQSNPTKLEAINQTIKKYNAALLAAKQSNEDLAIIQLKKVTSLSPNFLRAQQLLALLYIKAGEKDKALRCLKKISKIDINNITTIRYLKEVEVNEQPEVKEPAERVSKPTAIYQTGTQYKEEKTNIWAYANLIIGVVIGIVAVYILIVPTVKKNVEMKYANQEDVYQDEISAKEYTIDTLEGTNQELQDEIEDITTELTELKENMFDESIYDNMFDAVVLFQEGKNVKAAEKLLEVDTKKLSSAKAKKVYNAIKEATFSEGSKELYQEGKSKYDSGNYDEAITIFEKAIKLDEANADAIYFLGRCYHRKNDYVKAREYYETIMNQYEDSTRYAEAKKMLQTLPE
ncbi:tetratricopeptide repeat protein [Anaeromicropila populeti]|uniref:Tetratricopeptide repeat-containing protein n=1 Tax=Anaeromicropila populeti TaxID=37658 RepID=A0A1I6JQF7_9FIRM|nr:tetratricopeptide repeat protein [Anaeromicropila populeti]SFR81215.1 Tetratricopeptide repeat-containing protein [Anaeromicropila populeti]